MERGALAHIKAAPLSFHVVQSEQLHFPSGNQADFTGKAFVNYSILEKKSLREI